MAKEISIFFAASLASVFSISTAYAAQHRIGTCQAIHDRCVQNVHDNNKDDPKGLANCEKKLNIALTTGDSGIGLWPGGNNGSVFCQKSPL